MYPSLNEINNANQEQLGRWYRHLPSPQNNEEVKKINLIVKRFKGFNSNLSKKIGW